LMEEEEEEEKVFTFFLLFFLCGLDQRGLDKPRRRFFIEACRCVACVTGM